jgi:TetR/AcrR family transcriptional regulator, transcriptional repressor for nem operon
MTTKAEQKHHTNETILQSAARLVRERGISGARVADVMKGAGLTVGGFYAHFASKEALIDTTLRRTAREMRARLFARLDAKPEADRAEVVLKRYLSAAHRDDVTGGCVFPAVVGEVATTASEHAKVLGEELDAFAGELETYLPGPAPGPGGDKLPRRQLALATLALMYGGLSLARAVRGTPLSDEIIRACRAFGRLVARPEPSEPTPPAYRS